MYRKLVSFDGRRFGEVDQVALVRTARRLLALLQKIDSVDDPYGIFSRLLPALEASIDGRVTKPFTDEHEIIDGRYMYEDLEGLLPSYFDREFQKAFADFSVTARALPLDPPEIEQVGGRQCAWMSFEEEGDWPDKVKYP